MDTLQICTQAHLLKVEWYILFLLFIFQAQALSKMKAVTELLQLIDRVWSNFKSYFWIIIDILVNLTLGLPAGGHFMEVGHSIEVCHKLA